MSKLILNVKKEYFDQIKSGEKKHEYRLITDYWSKRIRGRWYESVEIRMGYPKNTDSDRIIEFPWNGYDVKIIHHNHFGRKPVKVFAIILRKDEK